MFDLTTVPAMATVTEIRHLSGDIAFYRLHLEEEAAAGLFTFIPGQFVQLSVPAAGEAPISLAGPPQKNGILELCIRKAGHVTSALRLLTVGEKMGVRGPFGNGFPVAKWGGRNILLLAGGLGIAPLRSLLYHLLERRRDYGDITFMYGAREPAAILFREELSELSCRRDMRLLLTVDFMTSEPPGALTCNIGLLPDLLKGVVFPAENTVAAVCGPPALYRCVVGELQGFGLPEDSIYLSLERRMKCGTGLCCHCAAGPLFCCTDGPVFRFSELRGIPAAL